MGLLTKVFFSISAVSVVVASYFGIQELVKIEPTSITLDSDLVSEPIKETTRLGGVIENKSKLIADIEENKEWWRHKYEKYIFNQKNINLSSKFVVTKGYGEESTALNKVCQSAYSKTRADFEKPTTSLENKKHDNEIYLENVSNYCTKKPNTHLVLPSNPVNL